MTVSVSTWKAGPYIGNNSATVFSFDFKCLSKNDLLVVRTLVSTGYETNLILDSDYSVTLNSDQEVNPGGSVTYPISGTPLSSTHKLTIVSNVDIEQTTDITNGGGFYPQTIENALDKLTILVAQQNEVLSRAVTVGVSSTDNPSELINTLFEQVEDVNAAASSAAASASASAASASASANSATSAAASEEYVESIANDIQGYVDSSVQTALGNVATPPQFDNDTSIATTEFVQRALGNFRSIATYNTNTNLSSSDIGKLVAPLGNSITFNLPSASASAAGSRIVFYGNNYNNTVISGNGNNIAYGALGSVASISLGATDTLELFNVGGTWYAIGGTAYLTASSAFSATLGLNGSVNTPKFTIKTGQITANVSSTNTWLSSNVVYATSFNTATIGIIVLERSNTSSAPVIGLNNIATGDWTASGFKLWVFDSAQTGTAYLNYIAIGY